MENRNIAIVINQLLALIPEELETFRKSLTVLRESCLYMPPESQYREWHKLGEIFNKYIPFPPEESWEKEAIKIFTTEEL